VNCARGCGCGSVKRVEQRFSEGKGERGDALRERCGGAEGADAETVRRTGVKFILSL